MLAQSAQRNLGVLCVFCGDNAVAAA